MPKDKTEKRKKDHIELCLTDKVAFRNKTNGFDHYEFVHFAITEVRISEIEFGMKFLGRPINYPFMISCMTGGTSEAESINEKLARVASILNIPVGVGSQRQALENDKLHSSYRTIRNNARNVPVLGNIGAAQIVQFKDAVSSVRFLADLVEADSMVIHVNPLQELLQPEGETDFKGLLKKIGMICSSIEIPVIVKEVGSGISREAARRLLEAGVKGIDLAGSGGTSWAAVEMLRAGSGEEYFREWGLPTSYCVRTVSELKKKFDFSLIASGGINSGVDIAKALALGADITASARIILQEVVDSGVESAVSLIEGWFGTVKKIMYLTGASSVKQLRKSRLIKKEEIY